VQAQVTLTVRPRARRRAILTMSPSARHTPMPFAGSWRRQRSMPPLPSVYYESEACANAYVTLSRLFAKGLVTSCRSRRKILP
jgi:hypothetical protein